MILKKINNYFLFILFSIFIYLLNPKVSEFSQFGSILSGLQKFENDSYFINLIYKDFSSQIVISSLITILFNSKLITEFLGGIINTIIAFLAIYHWVRLFDNSFKLNKNNQRIFLCTIIFYILEFDLNLSYPIKFPISYAIFGNSGMWLSIMVIGMMLRQKSSGYFFFGILLSWHLAWSILIFIIIFSIKNFFKTENKLNIKKILHFTLGLAISVIFYFYFLFKRNELLSFINLGDTYNYLSILKLKLIEPTQVTYHNIGLFDFFSFFKIILIISFGLHLIKSIKKLDIDLGFLKKIIINFSILGIFLTLYVSAASHVPLIGADIIARIIPNRIFNLLIIINSLLSFYFLSFLVENHAIDKKNILSLLLSIIWLNIAHSISGFAVTILLIFILIIKNLNYKKIIFNIPNQLINFFYIFIIVLLLMIKIFILNKYYYTIYDYLANKNEVIKALKNINARDGLILTGPNIPPAHGFNIYLSTNAEYVLPLSTGFNKYFEDISKITKCQKKPKLHMSFKYELDWYCMGNIKTSEWKKIYKRTSISYVLMKNEKEFVPLKLPMIAQTNHFILYTLKTK